LQRTRSAIAPTGFPLNLSQVCKDAAERPYDRRDRRRYSDDREDSAPTTSFDSYIPRCVNRNNTFDVSLPRQNASVTDHSETTADYRSFTALHPCKRRHAAANTLTPRVSAPLTFRPPVFISEIVGRDLRRNRESATPRDTRATAGTNTPKNPCVWPGQSQASVGPALNFEIAIST